MSAALTGRCGGCHGRRIANAGLDVTSYPSLLQGGRSGPAIRPCDADGSVLVKKVSGGHFARLSDSENTTLRAWIDAGAPGPSAGRGAAVSASWASLQPVLKGSCGACHGKHSPQKGLTVTDHEALLEGSASGPVVVPGNAGESGLLAVLQAGHFAKLSAGEMKALQAWIEAGAAADGVAPAGAIRDGAEEAAVEPLSPEYHATREVSADGLPCVGCHSKQATAVGTDHDGALVAVGERNQTCLTCHQPDQQGPYRMEVASGNPASGRCLACHNGKQTRRVGFVTHPDVPMTAAALPTDRTGTPPFYGVDGRPAAEGAAGNLACVTCHDPHRWSWAGDDRPGAVEGNSRSSFLRDPEEVIPYCTVCHGDDALPRYSYFHKAASWAGAL